MYTARLLYDVQGWAYYRRCQALEKYRPDDFEVTKGPDYGSAFRRKHHDLVLQLCYSHVRDIRRHLDSRGLLEMALVSGFNIGAGYADSWFSDVLTWSDHVVINSRSCWEALGRPEKTTQISNGVDRDQYRIRVAPAQRKPRVIWIGSTFHTASSNDTKGYRSHLLPLQERLRARGIECDFRRVNAHRAKDRMNGRELCEWYNRGTVYVVASKSEGTPNPALEAASAGCTICATRVGNMPELIEPGVNGELVDRTVDDLEAGVMRCVDRYREYHAAMEPAIERWHWRHRAADYFDLFRRLIDDIRANGPPPRADSGVVPHVQPRAGNTNKYTPVTPQDRIVARNVIQNYGRLPRSEATRIAGTLTDAQIDRLIDCQADESHREALVVEMLAELAGIEEP